MKNECSIVKDLLPLYEEKILRPDTARFVQEHLEKCAECQKENEQMKLPRIIATKTEAVPLKKIRRKILGKRIQTVAFTALLVVALLISAFAYFSAPQYLPYTEDLMSITENEDNSITITFSERVKSYSYDASIESNLYFNPPEGVEGDLSNLDYWEESPPYYAVRIEAWRSIWDHWFSKRGVQSATIQLPEDISYGVYYVENECIGHHGNDSQDPEQFAQQGDILIYGEMPTGTDGVVTLPRLVLAYYLVFAFIALSNLLGLWFIVRFALKRKTALRLWVERIALYPVSYILAHLAVKGFQTESFAIMRDFTLIVFISVIIYCSTLLIHNVLRLRKELHEINK